MWYAVSQQPRLGKVLSVDPTVPRPVVVEVFEPQANAVGIARARFVRALDPDASSPYVDQITLHQIRLQMQHLTPKGYLTTKDRKRLEKCLEN